VGTERKSLKVGKNNIIEKPLLDSKKVLLPPLHIKLGLIKQFVKALNKDGKCFEYLGKQFPHISDAKLKEGIFDGPQIRKMLNDKKVITTMTGKKKLLSSAFKKLQRTS